jgi:hypothetical protein
VVVNTAAGLGPSNAPPSATDDYSDLVLPRPGATPAPEESDIRERPEPSSRKFGGVELPPAEDGPKLELDLPSTGSGAIGHMHTLAAPGALAAPRGGGLTLATIAGKSTGGSGTPLLMDVTPRALGIETVGGWCEHVIRRNAPIPVEQTRFFTTAADGQTSVRVSVCQGESRTFTDNQRLGAVELTGLAPAPRGEAKILVTFMLDANGTLDVKAVDAATGRSQQIRVQLVGGHTADELEHMRRRQEATIA